MEQGHQIAKRIKEMLAADPELKQIDLSRTEWLALCEFHSINDPTVNPKLEVVRNPINPMYHRATPDGLRSLTVNIID